MQAKLHKAVAMVRELLEPLNARFNPVTVTPGGSARLTVQRASRQAAAQPAAAADKVGGLRAYTAAQRQSAAG